MLDVVYKIPVPSTSFLTEAHFEMLPKRVCVLSYSYEAEEDDFTVIERMIYEGVESFQCTHYFSVSLQMIKAYDKILDIRKSVWLKEVTRNLSDNGGQIEGLKHFRTYFDDGPCYEFIYRSVRVLKEKHPVSAVIPSR